MADLGLHGLYWSARSLVFSTHRRLVEIQAIQAIQAILEVYGASGSKT